MLDRATHRSILQEEHCFLDRRSSSADSLRPHWPEGTRAVCSTCAATVFRRKNPHASPSSLSSSLLSRCSEYLLFRRGAFAETRKVKATAGQLVTITVDFSLDDRLQLPRLTDISLAPVIS